MNNKVLFGTVGGLLFGLLAGYIIGFEVHDAQEGRAPSVRVVGVAPGLTLKSHMLSDEQFAVLHQISPLGRSSTAADVAATVKFALENKSITGTTLLVDGGQHLMQFERDFSLMDLT